MLLVDVRSSTSIAKNMNSHEISQLMNCFYKPAIEVLVQADAFFDKLVRDEVIALFIPGYSGEQHAWKAIDAGRNF